MAPVCHADLTALQRAALVVWWLAAGDGLTTSQVARLLGLSTRRTTRLMRSLAATLPIACTDGTWYAVFDGDVRYCHCTPRLRAALLAWSMARVGTLTNEQGAQLTDCSPETVRRTLCVLSAVLPIYKPKNEPWQVLTGD